MSKARKSPVGPKTKHAAKAKKKMRRRARDPERRARAKEEGHLAAGSLIGGMLRANQHRVLDAICQQRNRGKKRLDPALGARVMAGQDCDPSRERFTQRRMSRRRAAVVAQAARRRGVVSAAAALFERKGEDAPISSVDE